MKKQLKRYIFLCFILPAIFLFAEELRASDKFSFSQAPEEKVNEKKVSAFFYIEEKKGKVAYFYIEEKKIKEKWQAKVAFLNGKINPKEVNGFIGMINLWYLDQLKNMPWFEEIEWTEEPPSLKLDLPHIENLSGSLAEIIYMFSPVWGIGISFGEQKKTISQAFKESWESLEEPPKLLEVDGQASINTSLRGLSFLVLLRKPKLTKNLDAHFYLGAGNYSSKIDWEIYEFWEGTMGEMSAFWENNWQVSGKGNTTGYKAGIEFSCRISKDICLFLSAGYRSIVFEKVTYREHVNEDSSGGLWLSSMEKPSTLDFSGMTGKIGIGVALK